MSLKTIANDLMTFAELRFTRSFTQCAHSLGINKASVSRAVARLEAHFEVSLLVRNARGVNFTNAGELVLQHAVDMETQLSALQRDIDDFMSAARGKLRVAAPSAVAMHRLSPLLPEFSGMHPHIDIELDLVEHTINPVTEQYDLVLTWYPPKEQLVYARRVTEYEVVIVAAPDYLNKHGEPDTPSINTENQTLPQH